MQGVYVQRLIINCYDKDWRNLQSSSEYTDFTVSYSYSEVPSLQTFCEIQVFSLLQSALQVNVCSLDVLLSDLVEAKEIPLKLAQRIRKFVHPRKIRYFKPTTLAQTDVTVRTIIAAPLLHEVDCLPLVFRDIC